jgi:hypothetical protein
MKISELLAHDILFPVSVIFFTVILYGIYFYIGSSEFFHRRVFPRFCSVDEMRGQAGGVHYKRLSAFLLFGLFPLLFVKLVYGENLRQFGFSFSSTKLHPIVILTTVVAAFPVILVSSKKASIRSQYPEVRSALFSKRSFALSALTYVLYYFGYEGLFRGFLLFGLRGYTGDWVATMVSMSFTTLTHLHTPGLVFIGSLSSGIIFPYFVFLSGSIWPVFVMHSLIGVGMDWLCVRSQRSSARKYLKQSPSL